MNDILEMYKEDLLRAILEFGTGNGEADTEDLLSDVGGDKRLFEKATLEMEEGKLLARARRECICLRREHKR